MRPVTFLLRQHTASDLPPLTKSAFLQQTEKHECTRSAIPNGQNVLPRAMASPPDQQAEHDEPPGSGFKTGSLAKEEHSATEKRRRDRIAEGSMLMASRLLVLQ